MLRNVLCICLVTLGTGLALAADKGDKAKSDLNDLRTAINSLQLTAQEKTQTSDLRENYDKQLDAAVERLKAAMAEKLVNDLRAALTEEHRQQLDSMLQAIKRRDAAIAAADKQLDDALAAVKLGDLKLAKGSIRSEQQLIEKVCMSDKNLREKYAAVKAKYNKEESDAVAKLAAPDPTDKAAVKVNQDAKKKIRDNAEALILQEARALLNDDQRAAIAHVGQAIKNHEAAVKAAKDGYEQDRKALVPKPATKAGGKGGAGKGGAGKGGARRPK